MPSAEEKAEKAERELAAAVSLAEKQYNSALKTVDALKDTSYATFRQQLERLGFHNDWHPSILDHAAGPPSAAVLRTHKHGLDTKNAYMILMSKTDGSAVEDILKDVELGNAREVFHLVHEYHYRTSISGRGEANTRFYSSTMEKTGTNVMQWYALVVENAKLLRQAGATVDDSDMLCLLLSGLLPDFSHVKLLIEDKDAMTLPLAKKKLMDYAMANKLMTLTKGGTQSGRANSFPVTDTPTGRGRGRGDRGGRGRGKGGRPRSTELCRLFLDGKCHYGEKCRFTHGPQAPTVNLTKAPQPSDRVNVAAADPSPSPITDHVFNLHATAAAAAPVVPAKPYDTMVQLVAARDHDIEPEPVHPPAQSRLPSLSAIVFMVTTLFSIACACLAALPRAIKKLTHVHAYPVGAIMLVTLGMLIGVAYGAVLKRQPFSNDDAPCSYISQDLATRACLFTSTTAAVAPDVDYEWCSDSGTNRFVTNDASDFVPGTVVNNETTIAVGGGTTVSNRSGTVIIDSLNHQHRITCTNVLLLPSCSMKLMPVSTFVKKGCTVTYHNTDRVHLSSAKGDTMLTGKEIDGLYFFRSRTVHNNTTNRTNHDVDTAPSPEAASFFGLKPGKISASAQDFPKQLYEAHCAYGHIHFDKLRKMLGLKKGDNPDCSACTIASSKARALAGQTYVRSTREGHRFHMDLGFTNNCEFVFQLYIDDYSRYGYIDILEDKSFVLLKWKELKAQVETHIYPAKVAVVRCDIEPIYQTAAWKDHHLECGIQQEHSSRHRHDQNCVVERAMGTIGISYRAQMELGCAPKCDSPDCLRHSMVIKNNSPTKANNGWTPFEKKVGMRLPMNAKLLKGPLFCLVFAHVYEEERAKHAPRGIACVYLGYDQVNNTFLVKEWRSGQRYYTADLTFHPSVFPYRANPQRIIGTLMQYDEMAPHLTNVLTKDPAVAPQRGKSTRVSEYLRPDGVDLSQVPDVDVAPSVNMIHNFGPDPATMEEALGMHDAVEWIAAELAEKASLKYHRVYDVVLRSSLLPHQRVFKDKAILRRKVNPPDEFNPLGSLDKHKYRLTIAAYTKMLKQGIDYVEKHSSTVQWNAIKIIIATAVQFDLDITTIDIRTFFLYGILTDVMHMEVPKGWEDDDKPRASAGEYEYVWRLNKSLYGLPQAGHCAQTALRATLEKGKKFKRTNADDCVYASTDNSTGYAAFGTHVDDLLVASEPAGTAKLIATMKSKFEITVKPEPTIFCGVQIHRVRKHKWLKLHQTAYTNALLEEYNVTNSRPVDTPMDPGTAKHLMLLPNEEATAQSIKLYQKIVGGLMWLLKTRPDMHFTLNLLSRYLKCATDAHVTIARGRPLKYLAGTADFGIVFAPGDGDWILSGAADSDLAGDLNSARSTSGTTTQLGEFGNISCSSKLDHKISTSTGQAETYALQGLCKEIIWDRHLLAELNHPMKDASPTHTDNDGVLKQSTKAVNHSIAKHYRIAQAFIRMVALGDTVKVLRVHTDLNQSDTLTKPLAKLAFERHRDAIMGPQTPPGGQ